MPVNPQIAAWLNKPYEPGKGDDVNDEERMAKAAEYSAYHLFKISEKMDRLIEETAGIRAFIIMQQNDSGEN